MPVFIADYEYTMFIFTIDCKLNFKGAKVDILKFLFHVDVRKIFVIFWQLLKHIEKIFTFKARTQFQLECKMGNNTM